MITEEIGDENALMVSPDITGRDIQVGDRIACASLNGTSARLRLGKVVKLNPGERFNHVRQEDGKWARVNYLGASMTIEWEPTRKKSTIQDTKKAVILSR